MAHKTSVVIRAVQTIKHTIKSDVPLFTCNPLITQASASIRKATDNLCMSGFSVTVVNACAPMAVDRLDPVVRLKSSAQGLSIASVLRNDAHAHQNLNYRLRTRDVETVLFRGSGNSEIPSLRHKF